MEAYMPDIESMPPPSLYGGAVVAIVLGVFYCFLGYRTIKLVIFMTAFLLAALFGGTVCWQLSQENLTVALAGGLLSGVAASLALVLLYRLGVFMVGMTAAVLVASGFLPEVTPLVALAIMAGAGIAGGVVALLVERPVLILATAAVGAWLIMAGSACLYYGPGFTSLYEQQLDEVSGRFILTLGWAVFMIAGAIAQFGSTPKKAKERGAK